MSTQLQTMIDNMPAKTGRSLEEWFQLLTAKGFAKHGEAMAFLKGEHGVGHGFANTIVQLHKKQAQAGEEVDLVASQYTGKEQLLPIYEALLTVVTSFGGEVEIAPKKTSVSIRRAKQFALIKPATKTRIDLGLKLKGKEPTDRLGPSGPFGTMCTHRVQLTEASQVDEELTAWLKEAFDSAT